MPSPVAGAQAEGAALLLVLYVKSGVACEIHSSAGAMGERFLLLPAVLSFPGFPNK